MVAYFYYNIINRITKTKSKGCVFVDNKIKELDNFLDSDETEKFYNSCYNIIKNAYLAGYNFGKRESENKDKDNIINLPK